VAWTGIASTLLIDGRTVSSTFQIPIDLDEISNSTMSLNSKKARLLKEADLIIWDEAPMAPLHALNAINRLMKKLMAKDHYFGGKFILLGGDFRQIPPVVAHGTRTQVIEASIRSGRIWQEFRKIIYSTL
jgi:hypothetical protein